MYRVEFNFDAVFRRLSDARGRLTDMLPVYQDIGEQVQRSTKSRFGRSEAPDGTKWRPKRPATIERYRQAKDPVSLKPLIGPTKRLGNEIHYLATRAQVEIGSSLEYSAVMQHGAAKGAFGTNRAGRPIPWGTIPARPFIGLSAQDERDILAIVDEHLGDTLDA